ncbi:MAG: alpha/beta hydrolase [Planctomycetota bacterium]|nr:alpha/beta hydrolase [Planctomycetota bacterium]
MSTFPATNVFAGLFIKAAFILMTTVLPWRGLNAEEPVQFLWPDKAPLAKGSEEKDRPNLMVYLAPAAKANGTAVIVCPGGGYGHLALGHEGRDVAEWFNSLGVSAFVFTYRHAGTGYQHPAPMLDAQRAIRLVRSKAKEWKLKPDAIGILGFSAGGHLASTTGTHFDHGDSIAADPIDRVSCRPDFMILAYPVISLTGPIAHQGSRKNLLGKDKDADEQLAKSLSNDTQVTAETPPTFLMHTGGDTAVPAENSVQFYLALRKAKVPVEMHIYEKGGHGFGLGTKDPLLATWPVRCADWMRVRGLIK